MTHYLGIDFANKDKNIGRCKLHVDNSNKMLCPTIVFAELNDSEFVAVDCPFGTTAGFFHLLNGDEPEHCEWDKGLKTRHTEKWLRRELWSYSTNDYWRKLEARVPQHYVNQTAHVKPSVELVIVPAFLYWMQCDRGLTLEQVAAARSGKGEIVEAHPRAFLYSIVERIFRKQQSKAGAVDWAGLLSCVARYKDQKTVSHVEERIQVYEFLQTHADSWLWDGFSLMPLQERLVETDHAFDAFLASLTAFAFACNQTVTFVEAGIRSDIVQIEGHISVLRQ